MKHGIHITPEKREKMALLAYEMRLAGYTISEIEAELDVSEPTIRNLLPVGRKISEAR
jgi:predicted transcriptional regulator